MRHATAAWVGALFALVATPAWAALTLNVESIELAPGETGFVEVFVTELPPAQNENLFAYAIALNLPQESPIHFGPGPLVRETTHHPFVFPAGTAIEDRGSDEFRIRAAAFLDFNTAPQNITDDEGFLRVPVTWRRDYSGPCVRVPITFEMTGGLTEMSDDIGNVIEFVPVSGSVGGLCPEPSSLLLALIGTPLFALRRRRRLSPAA